MENIRIPSPEETEHHKSLHPERYSDKPYPEIPEKTIKKYTYKIYYVKDNTQSEHSFLVDAFTQKHAKKAFQELGYKLSSILKIEKYAATVNIPKVQA